MPPLRSLFILFVKIRSVENIIIHSHLSSFFFIFHAFTVCTLSVQALIVVNAMHIYLYIYICLLPNYTRILCVYRAVRVYLCIFFVFFFDFSAPLSTNPTLFFIIISCTLSRKFGTSESNSWPNFRLTQEY